jgi:hypothetical protein
MSIGLLLQIYQTSKQKNKMKRISITFMLMFLVATMFGQSAKTSNDFKPSGAPIVDIYTDFHTNFSNGGSASQFEIGRAYFGYGYKFSPYFSTQVKLDVGNPGVGGLQMTAYLKAAEVTYNRDGFKAQFGLIGTSAFGMIEHDWQNRYLFKTLQDNNGFNPSADLGVLLSYKFAPFISADISMFNGEGYKHLQADSTFKYAFGVTLTPVKGLNIRGYYDVMTKTASQQTVSLFANYVSGGFSIAAEYDKQVNHGMVSGKNYSGVSFFANYRFNKSVKIFGRYDNVTSATMTGQADPWNYKKDGSYVIAGVELNPVKNIRVSPNLQVWSPKVSSQHSLTAAYLSMEFKF